MEPPPQAKLAAHCPELRLFAGSSSYQDVDVMELSISSSSWTSNNQKRKRNQVVVPDEIIDVDEDDDPEVVFIGGSSSNYKNKQLMKFGKDSGIQIKDDLSNVGSRKNHMYALPQPKNVVSDAIALKFKAFKQFDTVQGDIDHVYAKAVQKPSKVWTKRIQHEWKVMEKDLPDMIYVRVYEDRMDILRAAIIGAAGTPYHDGLFFFDAYFPPNYPHSPPILRYHSGGLRLNPNLYDCGKVCLSLLGTWGGSGCEQWNPSKSSMVQVLVSIQALVLNAKPFFNEPYAPSANTPHGEYHSFLYNENTFLLSCRTMLYSLQRPPKHFEDFVVGHFGKRGKAILVACKSYMDGAQVGCLVGGGVQDVDEGDKSCSENFRNSLKILYDKLLKEFTDCDEFLTRNRRVGGADTTLKIRN